jgi:hypothetical protein
MAMGKPMRHPLSLRAVSFAVLIGIAFATAVEYAYGYLAARPWPIWYGSWAHNHKHLALELGTMVIQVLPIALLAAVAGVVLARLARSTSMIVPLIALAVWLLGMVWLLPLWQGVAWREQWRDYQYLAQLWPVSTLAGVVLPSLAMIYAFRRYPGQPAGNRRR